MKLSIITDEFTQDTGEAVALAVHYGLDGLELRTIEDKGLFELSDDEAKRIAARVADAGLAVSALASPFFKCDMDDDAQVAAHLEGLARCVRLAGIFDTRIIRGFAFWRREGARVHDIARMFREPVKMLDEAGLTLALENDPSVNTCNAAELRRLLEAVDSPRIGAMWDPGNNLFAPAPERPFPEGYEIIKPYLRHVHLKDARIGTDGQPAVCRLTGGEARIGEMLAALRSDGYEGFVTLEPHYRSQGVLSDAAMRTPGGASFSAGGYDSARESIETALALLGRGPGAHEKKKRA